MFREHFSLQIPLPKFFIGQSPSALALFVVPGTKKTGVSIPGVP
jgi:hypothetical protein